MIAAMWRGIYSLRYWNAFKWAMLGCLAVNGLCIAVAHADEDLRDLAGRVEYSYYAADVRGLQQSLDALAKLSGDVPTADLAESYLNYGRWKLSQLLAKNDSGRAAELAETCADTKPASKNAANLATQHALVAACLEMLGELRPLRRILYRNHRDAELAAAQQTGSAVAQVQFIAAWIASRLNEPTSPNAALKQALAQFDVAETAAGSSNSGWGHAEACYLQGKAESARGDLLAARNALEQALVLAPDYRDAQQLLRSLTLK